MDVFAHLGPTTVLIKLGDLCLAYSYQERAWWAARSA
jgi:hypothetical protein